MTEHHPDPISDDSSEGDYVDQHTEIATEPDDEPATEDLADDAWGADIADVSDQQIPARLAEEDDS